MREIQRAGALLAATLSLAALGATSAVAGQAATPESARPTGNMCSAWQGWGQACYLSYGDYVTAVDWKADGKWVKAVVQTTSGRDLYCADKSSAGEERYCDYNISESERIRVRAELWDGNDFQTATGWSTRVSA